MNNPFRHRSTDPAGSGVGWEISRAVEPWYQVIKKVGTLLLLIPLLKLAFELGELPKQVMDLTGRVEALERMPSEVRQLKVATCLGIASRERRFHAGCPAEVEQIINSTPQSPGGQ